MTFHIFIFGNVPRTDAPIVQINDLHGYSTDLKGWLGAVVARACVCVRACAGGDSMWSKPGRRSTPTTNGTREHKMQKRLEAVCEIKVCYFIRRKCSNLEHQECVHVLGLDFPPLHHGWRGRLQELGRDLSAPNLFVVMEVSGERQRMWTVCVKMDGGMACADVNGTTPSLTRARATWFAHTLALSATYRGPRSTTLRTLIYASTANNIIAYANLCAWERWRCGASAGRASTALWASDRPSTSWSDSHNTAGGVPACRVGVQYSCFGAYDRKTPTRNQYGYHTSTNVRTNKSKKSNKQNSITTAQDIATAQQQIKTKSNQKCMRNCVISLAQSSHKSNKLCTTRQHIIPRQWQQFWFFCSPLLSRLPCCCVFSRGRAPVRKLQKTSFSKTGNRTFWADPITWIYA